MHKLRERVCVCVLKYVMSKQEIVINRKKCRKKASKTSQALTHHRVWEEVWIISWYVGGIKLPRLLMNEGDVSGS